MKMIDPWGSELPEDYAKVIKDFGLDNFESDIFPEPSNHIFAVPTVPPPGIFFKIVVWLYISGSKSE